jgi:hypothetical protein
LANLIEQCSICNVKRFDHQIVVRLEGTTCCYFCVEEHDRSGMFQVYQDRPEELATCLILDAWNSLGEEDDFMSNEGWGYCARFGQYLLMQDSSGFITYEDYDTEEKAQKRYDELYEDGWGADENDAYIGQDRGKWIAVFEGKHLDIWSPHHKRYDYDEGITRRRALARVRLEMMRTGYYPNVWEEHERGGLTLIKEL